MTPLFEKEVENLKALRARNDADAVSKAEKDLYAEAARFLVGFCAGGLLFFEKDLERMTKEVGKRILSKENLRTIRRLLIEQGDCAAFDDFAARLFDETVEFYDEYFSEHVIEKVGLPYSELHEMYWDEESQCWWRRDGGTITTTSFMPYKGTPLKIVPT